MTAEIKNKILDILKTGDKFTIGAIKKQCFFSPSAIRKLLLELIEEGKVNKTVDSDNTGYYSFVPVSSAKVARKNKGYSPDKSKLVKPALQQFDTNNLFAANDEIIITRTEAQEILGLSRIGWYRSRGLAGFPQEIKYGTGYPKFKKSEVIAFRDSCVC